MTQRRQRDLTVANAQWEPWEPEVDAYPVRPRMQNFVAPERTIEPVKAEPIAPAWLGNEPPIDVSPAFAVAPGTREHTSAMDRARALRVRMFPFVVIWAGVGLIVLSALLFAAVEWPLASLAGALVFAAMSAVTYYRLNRTDYDYSREGTERHRLDVAENIAHARMEHEQELKRMALDAYIRMMERMHR